MKKEEIKENLEAKETQDPQAEPDTAQDEKPAKPAQPLQAITDPAEQIRKMGRGKMVLETPILVADKPVNELHYDFTKLTGWEYADAMDSDLSSSNIFRISSKQGLLLFAAAAAKETEGVDATDIRERIGVSDAIKAVQVATVFFVASTREGNKRISNG